uniref:Heat stress transcription factor A-4b n=1 Tax=Anthurium amnicola TaxID=1678845 RepID=A0A1D1YD84_9ARAE
MEGSQGSSNSPPPFLTKTYDMVDDPASDAIVSWSPTNNSFIVWDPLEFSRSMLPKYFKHNNFSSFVRQLNTYGFRKIDPNQWEFANDEFMRGQMHLLKNIHRRKPVHSHSLHNPSSSGPLTEAERQEFEEEIERLKQEKCMFIAALQKHKHGLELQMQSLEGRLYNLEHRQRQLMAFLTQVVHKHGFLSNLVQQSEIHGKKRRLPKTYYFRDDSGVEENHIVSFQPVAREKVDDSVLIMDTEPFEKMESSLNSLESFFRGVSHASGEVYDCSAPQGPSVVLTEIHTLSGDTDVNLHSHSHSQSPELHPSPCSGDIRTSPDLADSTNYAESVVIPPMELHIEQPRASEIDVNTEPVASEDPSLCDEAKLPTYSALPSGVNDVFWEQFFTETPGSSNESQSESQDVKSRRADVKTTDGGSSWWTQKNLDHITEQMGHLTPTERTR